MATEPARAPILLDSARGSRYLGLTRMNAPRQRRWIRRLAAMVLVPLALLAAAEGLLRLAGYGVPTSFFLETPRRGILRANPRFCWQFDPPALARGPLYLAIPAEKPAGTCRIVVLGESAARGTPDPAYSFSRILDAMLQERFPRLPVEVINTGVTAINSHGIRRIASDCVPRQGDLYILYMGHNEIVGPYGPAALSTPFSPHLALIRLALRARTLRLGQALRTLTDRAVRHPHPETAWLGMEMFSRGRISSDDPRLPAVYSHFRHNLDAILRTLLATDAEVLLCTAASNLRECPPFASLHRAGLSGPALRQWDAQYRDGIEAEQAGDPAAALAAYRNAAALDDRFAELRFRMGRCCLRLGDPASARTHFAAALDFDALRVRADSRVNAAIRAAAARPAAGRLQLVDVEQALAAAAPDAIPGGESFHEHVHPNWEGNYRIAAALFPRVAAVLRRRFPDRMPPDPGLALPPSPDECAAPLAFTDYARYKMERDMEGMVRHPPFTGQLDHDQAMAQCRRRIALLEPALDPARLPETIEVFRRAVQRRPADSLLRHNLAHVLIKAGLFHEAIEHLQGVVLAAEPENFEAWNTLGVALSALRQDAEAIEAYRRAAALNPYYADAYSNLGVVYGNQGRHEEELPLYRKALEVNPRYAAAWNNLGSALKDLGRLDEAADAFRRVLAIDPWHANACRNLAVVYSAAGRPGDAIAAARDATRIDPRDAGLQELLGQFLDSAERRPEALEAFLRAVELNPALPSAHYRAAIVAYNLGRYDLAVRSYDLGRELGAVDPDLEKLLAPHRTP